MSSQLHVCLRPSADTAIETDAASKLGPHLRIGDDRDSIDLWLPFGTDKALTFCRRLSEALVELTLTLAEHSTAYSAPQ